MKIGISGNEQKDNGQQKNYKDEVFPEVVSGKMIW